MREHEIPLLPTMYERTGEAFVNEFMPGFRQQTKDFISSRLRNTISEFIDDRSGEFKKTVIDTMASLREIMRPPESDRPRMARHELKVERAMQRYFYYISRFEGEADLGRPAPQTSGEEFDVKKFSKIFLDLHKHFGEKEAKTFLNRMDRLETGHYAPGVIDNERFWQLVDKVKNENGVHAAGFFAWQLHYLTDTTKGFNELDEQGVINTQNHLTKIFTKIYKSSARKNIEPFFEGARVLLWEGVENLNGFADLSIEATNRFNSSISPRIILNTAQLEKMEDLDYTGHQLMADTEQISNVFDEKAALIYVSGVEGILKNRYMDGLSLKWTVADVESRGENWYERMIKKNEESDLKPYDKYARYTLIRDTQAGIETKKKFIPKAEEDLLKVDPLIFKSCYLKILRNFGVNEASLYSRLWRVGIVHYMDEKAEPDIKILLNFSEKLTSLKEVVGEEFYREVISFSNKMTRFGTRFIVNFFDGIKKCYTKFGIEETKRRIDYTYKDYVYYYAQNHFDFFHKSIKGLEKPVKIERGRRHRLSKQQREDQKIFEKLAKEEREKRTK